MSKKEKSQLKRLQDQIDLVAKTILTHCPDEIENESACEVASKLIKRHYKKKV